MDSCFIVWLIHRARVGRGYQHKPPISLDLQIQMQHTYTLFQFNLLIFVSMPFVPKSHGFVFIDKRRGALAHHIIKLFCFNLLIFVWMSFVPKSHVFVLTGKKGGALASGIYSCMQHGDPFVRSVIKLNLTMVGACDFLLYRQSTKVTRNHIRRF